MSDAQPLGTAAEPPVIAAAARPRWRAPGNGQVLLGIGLIMLAVMIAVTVFAPLIAPFDPSATSPDALAGSSAEHWLGTD